MEQKQVESRGQYNREPPHLIETRQAIPSPYARRLGSR